MQWWTSFVQISKRCAPLCSLCIIVAWGGLLRFNDLGKQSFWLDEAVVVSQARGILQHGIPQMENGVVQWNSSFSAYITAQGLRLAGDHHVGARLPAALGGTLTVILIFLVAHNFSVGNTPALVAAAVMAFSTDQIAWSRQAEPYIYLQMFLVLTIWCLLNCALRRSTWWLAAGVLSAVACVGTHGGGYIAVLTVCLFCMTVIIFRAFSALLPSGEASPSRYATSKVTFSGIRRTVPVVLTLGALIALALVVRLPLGHSNITVVTNLLQNPYGTNYSYQYANVLLHSFGISGVLFAIIGVAAASTVRPRLAIPLVMTAGTFFVVVSLRMWMFAERYIFPIQAIIILFIALGVAIGSTFLGRITGKHRRGFVSALACSTVFGLFAFQTHATFSPRGEYWLGYTAPQPDWRNAFALVRSRHEAAMKSPQSLNVVSPYPVLHDMYLGPGTGHKFYLPISFCGQPNGVEWNAPHSRASFIRTLEELKRIDGYLLMDDMALRMVGDEEISSYLRNTEPDAVVASRFHVLIWLLGNETKPNKALLTYNLPVDGQVEGER